MTATLRKRVRAWRRDRSMRRFVAAWRPAEAATWSRLSPVERMALRSRAAMDQIGVDVTDLTDEQVLTGMAKLEEWGDVSNTDALIVFGELRKASAERR